MALAEIFCSRLERPMASSLERMCCKDGAIDRTSGNRDSATGKDGAIVAPEMVISLQKEPQITSALLQCDPMGIEESIDLL